MSERVEQLRLRWDRQEELSEEELALLLRDEDSDVRTLSARIAFEQAMRPALDAIGRSLAAEGRYDEESDWVVEGAQIARYDEPVPFMLKHAGLAAIERGDLDAAINALFNSMVWAMRQGQRGDERSRRLMRYAMDPDFDRAYEAIARRISAPRYYRPSGERIRVAVLIPFDRDGNSVALVGTGLAVGLAERGLDAFVVTTGMLPAPADSAQLRRLQAVGSRRLEPQGQSNSAKIQSLLDLFEREPVHAVVYVSDPQDVVPRICEIIGLANAQIFVNAAYEHRTGRLDASVQTVEAAQVDRSLRPEIAVFIPTGIVRDQAVIAATAAPRPAFGIPEDAIVLCTFGRLSKLAQRGFLDAVTSILRQEPRAVWLVAGAGTPDETGAIKDAIAAAAVAERVITLGECGDEIAALLKMSDIYLDPFPFPGAQSTGEAMFAGLPVVAMQRSDDTHLDPTQSGPTSAAGYAIIGDAAPMAPAGDVAAYVELARRYVNDPDERRRVGDAGRARADRALSWRGMIDGYLAVIEDAIARRAPIVNGEFAAVIVAPSPLSLERVLAKLAAERGLFAPRSFVAVVDGPHPDLELRLARYGDRISVVRLPESVGFAAAARAGCAASGARLCVVLDGTAMPERDWTAEGVACARRAGWGAVDGGIVVDVQHSGALETALASLDRIARKDPVAARVPGPVPQAEFLALQDRYEAQAPFSEAEIASLCGHTDRRVRALGERMIYESLVGPAFDAGLKLAELNPSEMRAVTAFITKGAVRARHPEAYVAAMKLEAEFELANGDVEKALHHLGWAFRIGMTYGQHGVKRWHHLLHIATDPDCDAIFTRAAARVSEPRHYPPYPGARRRFAIIVSVDYDANSLALVASRLAIGLRELGFETCYVSTEYYPSLANSATSRSLRASDVEVIFAEGATLLERCMDLLQRFARKPADAALFLVDPADPIARLVEIIGLSNAQALVTAGFDQGSGRIDAFVHTVAQHQVERAIHPERSVFIPTGIARDREILATTTPAPRAEFDLSPDDIVLCTTGRLNKAVQREFLAAVFGALRKDRRLKWLLIGPHDDRVLASLDNAIGAAGVGGQVNWPGAVHDKLPRWLLCADIYCDTFPFPGGQSLGEAMFAGLPVVAMQRVVDRDLDPTGSGPTSATADVFIGDAVPLVSAGDVAGYTARILAYAADPQLRKRDGERLRERAKATLGWCAMVEKYADLLESISNRVTPHARV